MRPELQRRMIGEIDSISRVPTDVVELDSSHSPFLSQPAELAGVIEKAWQSGNSERQFTAYSRSELRGELTKGNAGTG